MLGMDILRRLFDYAHVKHALWLRWRRLDFGGETCADIGVPEDRGAPHAHSGGPHLDGVLKSLHIPRGSRVVDLGSGKGIALITLSQHFDTVVGVEISERLVEICKRNLRLLGLRNIWVVCSDAARFTEFDDFSHVYMFNPFPANVMHEVMQNLRRSLESHPRRLTIIYKNPYCGDVIVSAGFREVARHEMKGSHPFVVYETGYFSSVTVDGSGTG